MHQHDFLLVRKLTGLTITSIAPHNLALSLRIARSFAPDEIRDDAVLRAAVRLQGKPALLELRQAHLQPPLMEVRCTPPAPPAEVKQMAEWCICADLSLQPFYRVALTHPVLAVIVEELHGLKPIRPASLFEMLIIAVTEQQISMAAAYRIRMRLVEHHGDRLDDLWTFPTAERLGNSSIGELMKCGLSQRKAEYVQGLAMRVASGQLDLGRMLTLPDEEVRATLLQERGLGPWSAEYFLIRGLSRMDRVPADDLGIRTLVGRYLGRGERLTAQGVMRKLAHFKPYRGLTVFYLLAHARMEKMTLDQER